ncbi:MAG: hypothetical protein Q9160_001110 [Pyrenula sp. 1 TL-2023]
METLQLFLLTFNCARTLIHPDVFSQYIFPNQDGQSPRPDIIVLNLQEHAPIGYAFLGGSFIAPYFKAFRQAIKLATKDTIYVNTISRNVGLTGIMVFVRQDLVSSIVSTQTAGVGVGIAELGNKGGVGVRISLQESDDDEPLTLTFVSAHLAPFEEAIERRNQDYEDIVRRLIFTSEKPSKPAHLDEGTEDVPLLQGTPSTSPSSNTSEETQMYHPTSHLFFAGDFNYRTSSSRPLPSDSPASSFPQPRPSPSSPQHFSTFLPRDQLTPERRANRTLHGLTEAPITFPPTYKYRWPSPQATNAHARALTDSDFSSSSSSSSYPWARYRWPSWCDRILYLPLPPWLPSSTPTPKLFPHSYTSLPLFPTSDHRPVALTLSIPFVPIPPPPPPQNPNLDIDTENDVRLNPPFPIDPTWRARRAAARKKEILVGVLAYLVLTWEGLGLLAATAVGLLGGWAVVWGLV